MEAEKTYNLDMVSVRLVHDPPLLSDHKIKTAEDAVQVIGELLGEMDREVICIINLKSDGTPICQHCHDHYKYKDKQENTYPVCFPAIPQYQSSPVHTPEKNSIT